MLNHRKKIPVRECACSINRGSKSDIEIRLDHSMRRDRHRCSLSLAVSPPACRPCRCKCQACFLVLPASVAQALSWIVHLLVAKPARVALERVARELHARCRDRLAPKRPTRVFHLGSVDSVMPGCTMQSSRGPARGLQAPRHVK